jgi:hypothetical protein
MPCRGIPYIPFFLLFRFGIVMFLLFHIKLDHRANDRRSWEFSQHERLEVTARARFEDFIQMEHDQSQTTCAIYISIN